MKNKKWEEAFNLPTVEDLFESTHGDYIGRVEKLELSRIKEFKGHPFKVKDDEEMVNQSAIENQVDEKL